MSAVKLLARKIRGVGAASLAQATQSATTFLVSMLAARLLGIEALGLFSILYGAFILAAGITTGFVGDSLIVLNRHNDRIRSGLFAWFVVLAFSLGVVGLVCSFLGTELDALGAALYALAAISYVAEDLVRRMHMAILSFSRIVLIDLSVMLVTGVVIAGIILAGQASIDSFMLAVVCGQTAGMVFGWFLLPKQERQGLKGPIGWKPVASYGFWRAALQALRPGQLTLTRIIVTAMIAMAAAGSLEVARIYAAPAALLVTGVCSYLFAHLARDSHSSIDAKLRRTDQAVLRLVGATAVCLVIGLALLPWAGPLLTGVVPSAIAVSGWLAYSMAIAVSTPYGQLSAVERRARSVFVIRLSDSVLSLLFVVGAIGMTHDYRWVPWAAALGALAGGFAIRRFVVVALVRSDFRISESDVQPEKATTGAPVPSLSSKEHDPS